MGRRRAKVRERLHRAQSDDDLVRLGRGDEFDALDGYVVGIGTDWVLLAVLDGAIVLDGYAALRLTDVRHVERRHTGDMVRKALALREQWPPTPPPAPLDLDNSRGLLMSLAEQSAITVHIEHDDPAVCFVGAPASLGRRSLRLIELSTRAVWSSGPTKYRVDDITRVDFGGRYEQALLSVAGPMPDGARPDDE